jgi:Tfp pilus assembly protein PilV
MIPAFYAGSLTGPLPAAANVYFTREHGSTIIEVVFAVLLLSVGFLAVASSAAWMTRMVGRSRQSVRVAALAQAKLESLWAGACEGPARGDSTAGPLVLSWSSTPSGAVVELRAMVSAPALSGARVDTFLAARACLP